MKCSNCRKEYRITSLHPFVGGGYICDDCLKNSCTSFVLCPGCGTVHLSGAICRCVTNKRATYNIMNYGYKPISLIANDDRKLDGFMLPKERYFGMEIEYNGIRCMLSRVGFDMLNDLIKDGYIYLKNDSSIADGAEMVTGILTYKRMVELIDRINNTGFLDAVRGLKNHRNNAGVHIHVSKNSIPVIDRYKLSLLFNKLDRTAETNRSVVEDILFYITNRCTKYGGDYRTNYTQYGAQRSIKPPECLDTMGRHITLNFSNDRTIEFRMFGTSANPNTLLSYLEFVKLSLEFVHDTGINDCTLHNLFLYMRSKTKNIVLKKKLNTVSDDMYKLSDKWVQDYSKVYKEVDKIKWYELYKYLVILDGVANPDEMVRRINSYRNGEYKKTFTKLNLGAGTRVLDYIENKIANELAKKL